MNPVNKILIVSFSYFLIANTTLANVLSSQNGNFAKLTFNNKDYCFKVSENSIKPIKNLGSCENLEALYATNNGAICLESTSIDCNSVVANGERYKWGNSGSITFYESISNLQSGKPTTNQSTNISAKSSTVASNSSGEMSGEELYKKAKEYFDNKEYQLAYDFARRSADKNYKGGYFGLGLAYEKGYGVVEKNIPRAIRMYQKAADLGHVAARGKVKRLSKKSTNSSSGSKVNDIRYSCTGTLWDFGTSGSSNSSESYWEYPEVKNGVLTVPKFGTYTLRGKKDKKIFWNRTEGEDKKYNWAKIDLGDGESLITKRDGYSIFQFKGRCSIKN